MNHFQKGRRVSLYELFYKSKGCLGWVVHGAVGYDWQNSNNLALLGEDLEESKDIKEPIEKVILAKDEKGKYLGAIYVIDVVKETSEVDRDWLVCETEEEAARNILDCYSKSVSE